MTQQIDWKGLAPRYALQPDLVLTPDGTRTDLVLSVDNGHIAGLLPATEAPADTIRLPGRAIVPGFIDAHTHLGQAFGKSFVFGEPSQIWQRIWGPLEGSLTPELMRASATMMMLEALRGGFTTIVNFAMADAERTAAVHEAAALTGMRLVSCTGASDLADYPTATPPRFMSIDDALRRAEAHLALCKDRPRVTASICCSGAQGATLDMIATLAKFSADHGMLFQFHSNEHFPEVHGTVIKHGIRPIEVLAKHGALGKHVLLHHVTLVNDREIGLLAETQTGVSYNPVASLWKGDGVAPALQFKERGVRFGIGTDSTRSDAFRLLDAADACQRVAYGMPKLDFSCGAGWTWVDAATRGSADVAGLGDVTGSLTPGRAADFLVLDINAPEVQPSWDFEWELARLTNRDQIDAVVVDGKPVLAKGKAIGWDQDAFLRDEVPKAIAHVKQSGARRVHGPSAGRRPG